MKRLNAKKVKLIMIEKKLKTLKNNVLKPMQKNILFCTANAFAKAAISYRRPTCAEEECYAIDGGTKTKLGINMEEKGDKIDKMAGGCTIEY